MIEALYTCRKRPEGIRGVTLLEVAVTVVIFGILITGAFTLLSQPFDIQREEQTISRLIGLKRAIIGDPRIVTREARTDFGFLGDTGSLPTSLDQLWTLGGLPTFTFNTNLKIGAGWAGPYVEVPPLSMFDDIVRDAWGTGIQYELVDEVSPATGQVARARLISYGPDTAPGGGDDLTVEIYETQMLSTVTGYVRDAVGNPLPGVTATMNYASSASLSGVSGPTDSTGAFTFTDIPFGNRSLVIEPQMVYVQDTAVTTGGQANDVEFVIQNYSSEGIGINSITVVHDAAAYYENVRLGNSTVFNYSTDNGGVRVGTGETASWSPATTVIGTGSISGRTFPVRVQSGFTLTPNQDIGEAAKKGGTLRIELQNFSSAPTGGSNVDMTGISFQVTFSDGSVAIFTTVRQ